MPRFTDAFTAPAIASIVNENASNRIHYLGEGLQIHYLGFFGRSILSIYKAAMLSVVLHEVESFIGFL